MSQRLFDPGKIAATQGIVIAFNDTTALLPFLHRHFSGDWSEMSEEDQHANRMAVETGDSRVFSAYETSEGKIWIITEADRSSTTVLFPAEY